MRGLVLLPRKTARYASCVFVLMASPFSPALRAENMIVRAFCWFAWSTAVSAEIFQTGSAPLG
jgi:hypothetical protein